MLSVMTVKVIYSSFRNLHTITTQQYDDTFFLVENCKLKLAKTKKGLQALERNSSL